MRRSRARNVLGLDLSLSGSAAVLLPERWRPGSWDFPTERVGHRLPRDASPEELADRLVDIVGALVFFARRYAAAHVFLEGGSYGQQGLALEGLKGAVRFALRAELGLAARSVAPVTARKYLLGGGKLPRGKGVVQALVHQRLRDAGAAWGPSDYGDAFVVASFGRTEIGLPGLVLA